MNRNIELFALFERLVGSFLMLFAKSSKLQVRQALILAHLTGLVAHSESVRHDLHEAEM